MKQQSLYQSFYKLAFFTVLMATVIVAVKTMVLKKLQVNNVFTAVYKPKQTGTTNIYFIGTSRTKCAIDDSLLNNDLPQVQCFNAGLGYGTFISNAVLAQKIMRTVQHATVIIELSVANGRMPDHFSLLCDPATTATAMWPLVQTTTLKELYHVYGPFTETYLTDYINPKPYMKLYTGSYQLKQLFGQQKKHDSLNYNPGTFLTAANIASAATAATLPDVYHTILQRLLSTAKQTNSQVLFVLPLTISDPAEKKRLLNLYNNISAAHQLRYSDSFLRSINNPAYLADAIHLNATGAVVYTNYVKEWIERKVVK